MPRLTPPQRSLLDIPVATDLRSLAADIAVIGAPHGTPYAASGDVAYDVATDSAAGPAAIRDAANQTSSNIDHWDFDLDGPLLGPGLRLVDCGDIAGAPGDGPGNRAAIEAAVRAVLAAGAMPLLLGGDDSVPIPYLRAFEGRGPFTLVQIDAHIDWRDSIGGERDGYSSTMRRASELPWIGRIVQISMRGVGSARAAEVEAARAWGARIVTAEAVRRSGAEAVAAAIPTDLPVLITVDCDAFDPSVCPAVNAPTPGGLLFHEVAALVRGAARGRRVAGFSIVELAPRHDVNGISAAAAARLVLNLIGTVARNGAG